MARTATAPGDDWGKWIMLATALVGVGVLPAKWGKPIAVAAVVTALLAILRD